MRASYAGHLSSCSFLSIQTLERSFQTLERDVLRAFSECLKWYSDSIQDKETALWKTALFSYPDKWHGMIAKVFQKIVAKKFR